MIIPNNDSVLPNENATKTRAAGSAVVVDIAVTGVNLALELFNILIPQLSSLSIQGRVAAKHISYYPSDMIPQQPERLHHQAVQVSIVTYLLGSPRRLCRLNSTVRML